MRRRYLVLRAFSPILRILGWILVVAGLVVFCVGLFSLVRPSSAMMDVVAGRNMLAGGIGTVVAGLVFVLYGEIIEVFVDIESNTRRTAEMMERLIAAPARPPA
jgi:vacuolar-type H+-ATPase subunit I/STV1